MIFISLEIIWNAFRVSQYHFWLKSLFWLWCHFCLFQFASLWICYAVKCVHFTVPSGRKNALFFLQKQEAHSGSTFIKKIKPFVCHYVSMPRQYIKKQDCKTNCFIIRHPSVDFWSFMMNWAYSVNNFIIHLH